MGIMRNGTYTRGLVGCLLDHIIVNCRFRVDSSRWIMVKKKRNEYTKLNFEGKLVEKLMDVCKRENRVDRPEHLP